MTLHQCFQVSSLYRKGNVSRLSFLGQHDGKTGKNDKKTKRTALRNQEK